ncbi:4Fe-4S binding protein [Thermanaerosceptrum fracticalcis]|nr:4Fe-4S binding protein [Thermanaerosceptrum fracticalcis]
METKRKVKPVAKILNERCDGNPWCPSMRVCPIGAIKVKESRGLIMKKVVLEVDKTKCTGCGKCLNYCAHRAITIN